MATLLLENGLFIAVTVICLLQNHRQAYIQGKDNVATAYSDWISVRLLLKWYLSKRIFKRTLFVMHAFWSHAILIYTFDFSIFFTGTSATSEASRQRKIGVNSDIIAKPKDSGVRFKESEHHAKMQVNLLTFRFGSYGLLGLVLGLPWVMAFAIVFSETSDDLWYPFVVFQGLQVKAGF